MFQYQAFDDKLKAEVSNNRDDYLDKILTVRANSIMPPTNNNNQYSLFLPVFIEFRLDKSEADDLQKIQGPIRIIKTQCA